MGILVSLPSKPAVTPSVSRDEWYSVIRESGNDLDICAAACGRLKERCSLGRGGGDNEYGAEAYLSDCCRLGLADRFPNSAVRRHSIIWGIGDYGPLVVGSVQAVHQVGYIVRERSQRVVGERAVFRDEVVRVEGMGEEFACGAELLNQNAHEGMGGGPAELVLGEIAGN
jgi:hypothetical protein